MHIGLCTEGRNGEPASIKTVFTGPVGSQLRVLCLQQGSNIPPPSFGCQATVNSATFAIQRAAAAVSDAQVRTPNFVMPFHKGEDDVRQSTPLETVVDGNHGQTLAFAERPLVVQPPPPPPPPHPVNTSMVCRGGGVLQAFVDCGGGQGFPPPDVRQLWGWWVVIPSLWSVHSMMGL